MIISIYVAFLFSSTFAAVNTQQLSTRVIELRKEVELVNDEYKLERETILNEMKVLSVQKAEIASNLRGEEIRRDQINEKIQILKKSIQKSSVESSELTPLLVESINALELYITKSLPFKTKERLDSLNRLNVRFNKKEISTVKAINQLWGLYEDEKRLARDTSLHKQTIPIDGKLHLAEVAKIGMLYMYFKTDQGQLGMAQRKEQEWIYQSFKGDEQQEQASVLLESLKKQIRQGYFEIPTQI